MRSVVQFFGKAGFGKDSDQLVSLDSLRVAVLEKSNRPLEMRLYAPVFDVELGRIVFNCDRCHLQKMVGVDRRRAVDPQTGRTLWYVPFQDSRIDGGIKYPSQDAHYIDPATGVRFARADVQFVWWSAKEVRDQMALVKAGKEKTVDYDLDYANAVVKNIGSLTVEYGELTGFVDRATPYLAKSQREGELRLPRAYMATNAELEISKDFIQQKVVEYVRLGAWNVLDCLAPVDGKVTNFAFTEDTDPTRNTMVEFTGDNGEVFMIPAGFDHRKHPKVGDHFKQGADLFPRRERVNHCDTPSYEVTTYAQACEFLDHELAFVENAIRKQIGLNAERVGDRKHLYPIDAIQAYATPEGQESRYFPGDAKIFFNLSDVAEPQAVYPDDLKGEWSFWSWDLKTTKFRNIPKKWVKPPKVSPVPQEVDAVPAPVETLESLEELWREHQAA